ncbi:hypothetical protein HUO09_12125 [Vibrio sp. Y2-5]|uniref:toxin VasX n=1 Tax=Vibrio sp. Y2-5 TaxID=2743977 RepID=UPI00166077BE|nr:toxin VasX [Vibrio sp. Y2-5]MBD0787092.1 hypothetical protein [Vibrio sp. Y2-5]
MSNANESANTASTKDSQSPVGTCPLKKNKLQLIPVRYGLVESKPAHPAVSSKLESKVSFRPVGVRPVESGYLYVIHSQRNDIIYVYEISGKGELKKLDQQYLEGDSSGQEYVYVESKTGLIVERSGNIEVLFSPTKISPKLQSHLLRSEPLRSKMMQSCNLGEFDCLSGSKHLLPTSALEQNLADCEPRKSDYEEPFQWCWLEEKPETYQADALLSHVKPEYKQDSAVLVLEDPMGIMTELASCDISINNMEVDWFEQDNNRAKYFAASQIKLLIEIGEQQFNANTNNGKLTQYISVHEQDLKERFIAYQQAKKLYWNLVADKTSAPHSRYSLSVDSIQSSPEFENYQQQRLLNNQMAQDIGITQTELESFFHQVKKDNDKLVEGEFGGWLGDRGILARIEYDEMENWYRDAQSNINQWRQLTDMIENDRVSVLPFAYDVIPVFDKENKDAFVARLLSENHWLENLAEDEENKKIVRDFFYASVGEQNLHTYVSNNEHIGTVEAKYNDWKEWAKYIPPIKGVKDGVDGTLDGLSGLREFQDLLQGQHLIEFDDVPDEVKTQLNRFGSKLSSFALDELNELVNNLNTAQGRANSLIYQARPGIIATLLVHKKNANVIFDVGGNAGIEHFNQHFSKLESIRAQAEELLTKRNNVETQSKGFTKAQKDAFRADYTRQIKLLTEESQQTLMALAASSEPVARTGQAHLPSHITVKASGATANDINELLLLRRKVLTNELLYGVSEGKGIKGAIGSGSVSLVIFAINAWNWGNTQQEFAQKSALTRAKFADYFASFTSFLAAGTSVAVEVLKIKARLDWIKLATEANEFAIGKVVTIGTASVSWLTAGSSLLDIYKQSQKISQSWRQGDIAPLLAASMAMTGDALQAWHAGKVAFKGAGLAMSAAQGQITWTVAAEQTFGVVARANPWMLTASALILLGEVGYNFLQSTPLMNWISQSSWGKNGIWFWHNKEDWDYDMQFTKWLEATQTPVVRVCTEAYKQEFMSASGNWATQVTKHRLKTLRIVVPMATPTQVRLAGYGVVLSSEEPINLTAELIKYSRVIYDGINTIYEMDWPQDFQRQKNLRYLDLMVEVTTIYGTILFVEQRGARFTLDLHNLGSQDTQDWYDIELLEEGDIQAVEKKQLSSSLTSIVNKTEAEHE